MNDNIVSLANAMISSEIQGAKSDLEKAKSELARAQAFFDICQTNLNAALVTHATSVTDLGKQLGLLTDQESVSAEDLGLSTNAIVTASTINALSGGSHETTVSEIQP